MSNLLKLAQAVDWIAERLSQIAAWAVLLAALISAGNAFIRYGLDISSNAWLEIQWYLFGTIVMLGAPLVLKLNEHVRVDIFYGRLPGKGPVWVDLFGLVFFLLPVMGLLTWLTWPFFWNMYVTKEMSGNIGGLIAGQRPCCCPWASARCSSRALLKSSSVWPTCVVPTRWTRTTRSRCSKPDAEPPTSQDVPECKWKTSRRSCSRG